MIEKYPHSYTDKDLVDKLNEAIGVVNTMAYKNNECSNNCRTTNQTNADRIRNMSDEELALSITCPAEYDLNFNKECGCNGEMNRNCRKCTLKWLRSEAE